MSTFSKAQYRYQPTVDTALMVDVALPVGTTSGTAIDVTVVVRDQSIPRSIMHLNICLGTELGYHRLQLPRSRPRA